MAVGIIFLNDDTKLFVLSGTMQYKVHERHINWMNGKLPYGLGLCWKYVEQKIVFMTVRKCF